jgi:hypothetical protein
MAGKIVHVEIAAEDVDRAQGFYSGVFGWEVGTSMMPDFDYRMFQSAEDQGGAIAPGEPGNFRVYLDVDDLDASVAKVREHGGEAGETTEVPGHGRLAHCRDTEGNAFSLWQGGASAGS